MKAIVAVGLGGALALGLVSCSDSRCNPKNCDYFLNTCHRVLPDAPDKTFSFCAPAGQPPANFDFNTYCPAACNAAHAGALLQCLTQHPECGDLVDGGAATAQSACAPGPVSSPNAGCASDCNLKREQCEQPCPAQSSFQACADCVATCSLNWQACVDACPRQ